MTKEELIAKQQLEIEYLKHRISEYEEGCGDALGHLIHAEQWSPKCTDFPKVAMRAIVVARNVLTDI